MITYNTITKEVELEEASSRIFNGDFPIGAKLDQLRMLLEQEPIVVKSMNEELKKSGIKLREGKKDFKFIPIEIVEDCLRLIFPEIDFIIKNSYRELNSFIVVCSLVFINPTDKKTRIIDGIGAKFIEPDRSSGQNQMAYDAAPNSIETAVGIAYSAAIKNAAKKIGKLFGSKLNKGEEAVATIDKGSKDVLALAELNKLFITKAKNLGEEARQRINEIIINEEEESYEKAIKNLKEI